MDAKRFGTKILIRCDKGDEIVESIKKVCLDNKVKLAAVTGIGAVNKVIIGLFDPVEKKYHSAEIDKTAEITGLNGNISTMNGDIYLHVHITLSDSTYNAFGGHLNYARVSCTAEIVIDIIDGEVDRYFNKEIGLNLIEL